MGLTGTHVEGDLGEVADNNLRDVAINQATANIAMLTADALTKVNAATVDAKVATAMAPLPATYAPGVSVKATGSVKGDGATDDTAAINAVIIANPGRGIMFPVGTYMVNATATIGAGGQPAGIMLNQPGTRLILDRGAVLKTIINNATHYSVVQVSAADCLIEGGTIQGDRLTHTGTTGEWGHCVDVAVGAHRLTIQDCTVRDAWGDGIQVTGKGLDQAFLNVRADSNRRQGMSIIDAIRPRVVGGAYLNTAAAPGVVGLGCGLLLEPDPASTHEVTDAVVSGVLFAANMGPGFASSSNGRPISVTVSGCRAVGCGGGATSGFRAYGATNKTAFLACDAVSNAPNGWLVDPDCVGIRITGCTATASTGNGFGVAGTRTTLTGCTATENIGSGFLLTGDQATLTGCTAHSNSSGAANVQIDITATNAHLTGCVSDAGSTTPNFGFVVRGGATGARLEGCTSKGVFGSGAYLDQTTTAYAFPAIAATRAGAIGSPTADVTSLKNAVDAIRVALTGLGITA